MGEQSGMNGRQGSFGWGGCLLALTLLLTLFAAPPSAEAAKRKLPAQVEATLLTNSQKLLHRQKGLKVRLWSIGPSRVRLAAVSGGKRSYFRPAKIRFKHRGKRYVNLRMTSAGRKAFNPCGARNVRVIATYRRGKKRLKSKSTKRIVRDAARCDGLAPDPVTTPGCDPIDPAACMAPFPNDYFTKSDPANATGLRLDFSPERMPANDKGKSIYSDAYNRNDGFSPNSVIVTKIDGLETPEVFRENGIVSQMDIGAYAEPDQRVVLIDTTTGARVPIWAELDMVPGTPNPHANGLVQGTAADRTLLIHPAQSLEYGRRYVVAVRNLTSGGAAIAASEVFGYLRDGTKTDNPQVEARRDQMERVFAETAKAGIDRGTLVTAWDFTVASERNLTERVVEMRRDAFTQLGDSDLADGKIQGATPDINDVQVTGYDTCPDTLPASACGTGESRYAFEKITGTITVPCYMNAPGTGYTTDAALANTPCASGSRLNYQGAGNLPAQKLDAQGDPVTWEAPFTCLVPRAAENDPAKAAPGLKAVLFGHGLMQSNATTEVLGRFPAGLTAVACGTDWMGLSASDLSQHLLKMMTPGNADLSIFSSLPDRTQQGYIDALYLARAMAHEDGLSSLPEFQEGGQPIFEVNQADTGQDLSYFGISLGGINGGAVTALAPDWERSTLSVPGIGFGTLLFRSIQFNQFLPIIYGSYPNPIDRALGLSMVQVLWDRGEPSAYSKSMLNGGLGTPPHKVLIHESFGDHQVANIQTETLARSIGAKIKGPSVDPGRWDDLSTIAQPEGKYLFTPMTEVDPQWNIPVVPSADFNQPGGLPGADAVMMTTDTGPIRTTPENGESGPRGVLGTTANPDRNIAPVSGDAANFRDGFDPHQPGATSPALQQMNMPYLLGQGLYDPCGDGVPDPFAQPPFATPTGSPNPVVCSVPAINYVRNGR